MNACAKPFSLSKLSKFPQNKKVGFPPDKTSEKPSPGAVFGDRSLLWEGKSQTKIPPKMDHPPWRLTGLYEKAPRKNDVFFLYKGKDWSGWLQSLVGW
jgi:hypothetical protein